MSRKFRIKVQGKTYDVEVEELNNTAPTKTNYTSPKQKPKPPTPAKPKISTEPKMKSKASSTEESTEIGEGTVKAPLPGEILRIMVNEGDHVSVGDPLLVLEAMKMENEIAAAKSGEIKEILVEKNTIVESGQDLVIIE